MSIPDAIPTRLNIFAADVHALAVSQGRWENSPSFPEIIALCHSELSEALEAYRSGEEPRVINYAIEECLGVNKKDECSECFVNAALICGLAKPDGIPIELADCILRILDYCGYADIDIETAIRVKHQYNQTRPYRHGGKKA